MPLIQRKQIEDGTTFPSSVAVPFTYATPSPMLLQVVRAGSSFARGAIVIDVPFDDPSAVVELGTAGDPDLLIAADTSIAAQYETEELLYQPVAEQLRLVIEPGASTQGSGRVMYEILEPPP